jgi:hypothetical protein
MDPHQLALVPDGPGNDPGNLSQVAAAIQKQLFEVDRVWGTTTVIQAFPRLEDLAHDIWPIIVTKEPGAGLGRHFAHDDKKRPYALVRLFGDWQATVSHEAVEMTVDPYGNLTLPGPSLLDASEEVDYLVEVCDPCQAIIYSRDNINLSNFCTPDYYGRPRSGLHDYCKRISRPFEVLPQGYITWRRRSDDHWIQYDLNGDGPHHEDLGVLDDPTMSIRTQVDMTDAATARFRTRKLSKKRPAQQFKDRTVRAARLRQAIASVGRR